MSTYTESVALTESGQTRVQRVMPNENQAVAGTVDGYRASDQVYKAFGAISRDYSNLQ